jgi:gliding motility-associated-like protein
MNMKKNENIEDLFKDKFEDFEADVTPTVWSNIQTALKGAGIGLLIKTLINKIGTNTLVAVVSSAATVVSTILIMQWTGNSDKTSAEKNQPNKTENIVPVKEEIILPENKTEVQKNESPVVETSKEKVENSSNKGTIKISKNQITEAVKEMNRKQIAFISPSTIAGPVPLVVNFENLGNGKINRWEFGDGKSEKNSANPVHLYDIPGIYTVLLYSKNVDGVSAVDTVTIEVYGNSSLPAQPTMFSPNGDGVNDLFVFQTKDIVEMDASIVDENGKMVFNCGIGCKWDGKDKQGKDVKVGKYYYMIKAIGVDGKKYERKGIINLTR